MMKVLCDSMSDRAGPIRGLWRILDGKVESGLISDLDL
jgi:hypothetical protein